ncbi:Crp/Fnr family transcriptional regulator [Lyngbya confervoides]|uniref:Crp/Fnr family transcriptional regulator n=1 Tax=Lyngbya confervoides BDU141951 TaxID=1574623 RepID=A0ABD4T0J0_9CYAN|nr:Crp/Fnr family transcriptional regulator [Lyngbya confervoides]MCM1982087.1 Crp/Fnr family transcriptional regulator [Lyngbya confervoides BDU141951]
MAKETVQAVSKEEVIQNLTQTNFLFRGLDTQEIAQYLETEDVSLEKLYSSRPIYTAYLPDVFLEYLYVIVQGGPVIVRSVPLDRVIALTYPGSCFGMMNLDFSYGRVYKGFPSLVEAYKTTDVLKIPQMIVQQLYQDYPQIQERYGTLFELREKFQYHLLNCSTYPPQAVAALLRALIYQERVLGNQPASEGIFSFDLPIDIIARACQLNHRTVEQVLKGMTKTGFLRSSKKSEAGHDLVQICDPEGLKEVYGATRDKVDWWPLR